jgi:hypothetical protein
MHIYHDFDVVLGTAEIVFAALYAAVAVRGQTGTRLASRCCFVACLVFMGFGTLSLGLTPPRLHWIYEYFRYAWIACLIAYLVVSSIPPKRS